MFGSADSQAGTYTEHAALTQSTPYRSRQPVKVSYMDPRGMHTQNQNIVSHHQVVTMATAVKILHSITVVVVIASNVMTVCL